MSRIRVAARAMAIVPAVASTAAGCPVCVSDTGVQIRAMVAADPVWHMAVTAAPIPAILAVVALVRFATPFILREKP